MILYEYRREKVQIYAKEFSWCQLKKPLIVSICALLLSIYFLLVGYLYDREALRMGYEWLCLAIVVTISASIRSSRINKKIITEMFGDFEVLYCSIEQIGFVCLVKNITKNKELSFMQSEVKKVSFLDNIIVVKLTKRRVTFFPKIDSIEMLFEPFKKKRKK